jgi:hypothetical protein
LEGKARLAERIPTYSYLNKHMIRAKIPTNPDYEWNYLFFKWMRLWVEYDDDWYSMANIDYEVLDDLPDDDPHFYVDADLEQLED